MADLDLDLDLDFGFVAEIVCIGLGMSVVVVVLELAVVVEVDDNLVAVVGLAVDYNLVGCKAGSSRCSLVADLTFFQLVFLTVLNRCVDDVVEDEETEILTFFKNRMKKNCVQMKQSSAMLKVCGNASDSQVPMR